MKIEMQLPCMHDTMFWSLTQYYTMHFKNSLFYDFASEYDCMLDLKSMYFFSSFNPQGRLRSKNEWYIWTFFSQPTIPRHSIQWNVDITLLWGPRFFNVILKVTLYGGRFIWIPMKGEIFSTLYQEKTLYRGMLYRGFTIISWNDFFMPARDLDTEHWMFFFFFFGMCELQSRIELREPSLTRTKPYMVKKYSIVSSWS